MLINKAYRKGLLNVIVCHTNFSWCPERNLEISMYYKTHSDILGKLMFCGIYAIISKRALFSVTTYQGYDFWELSNFPVRLVIINIRNMD